MMWECCDEGRECFSRPEKERRRDRRVNCVGVWEEQPVSGLVSSWVAGQSSSGTERSSLVVRDVQLPLPAKTD
ncbi:hypothetical protein Ddc_12390 [Ditylenchus destructor]|nr:hypothetical protein Ddc_12390 [Ditylenchus destructor]